MVLTGPPFLVTSSSEWAMTELMVAAETPAPRRTMARRAAFLKMDIMMVVCLSWKVGGCLCKEQTLELEIFEVQRGFIAR